VARVLLVMPRLPQRLGTPYLGQLYIAASLLADGHEVRCVDCSAALWRGDDDDVVAIAREFDPDLIGMTLFTYNAARGYRLAKRLASGTRLLLAGGPHPTVMPGEPVNHGFDLSLAGEGEHAILRIAAFVDGEGDLESIPGLSTRASLGLPSHSIGNLDGLPYPHEGYETFDLEVYQPDGRGVVPGGLMTSRGCPARCTFCANYVTGRVYRYRSTENIIEEMRQLRAAYGINTFPFWDDAFTALRPRLKELCEAIQVESELDGISWSCITPGNMIKPIDLDRMRAAGCVSVNFGIESGDARILKAIQKGQRPDDIRAAVKSAKAAGMTTVVNFMFGFPGEGTDELKCTQDLMSELAETTDYFNTRGVLVPFPGTRIYDQWADTYDLRDWWLDVANVPIEPDFSDPEDLLDYQETDPTLALDFFHYSDEVRTAVEACVRFKAEHNRARIRRLQQGLF
jgi:anaerobic magnesium-protoporphyrin IX monomethyl ester cyclase